MGLFIIYIINVIFMGPGGVSLVKLLVKRDLYAEQQAKGRYQRTASNSMYPMH
jgi:hypothetical protein